MDVPLPFVIRHPSTLDPRPATLYVVAVSKIRSFISYWLLPLLWMSLIFLGSSDTRSYQHSSFIVEPLLHWLFPHMSQARVEAIHHVVRKCAHFTEYAVLALLLWRAVRKPLRNDPRPWRWREAAIAIGIVFLYAASDEFHQRYVPTRTPLVSDVFIDTSGAMLGMLVLWTLGRLFKWWPKVVPKELLENSPAFQRREPEPPEDESRRDD